MSLYHDAKSGEVSSSIAFWRDEYALNAAIARYPKPYVAIMDGIVLGGGIGLSAHGSHRVVTERSKLGLPETGIGFIPDVGATWLLSRAPGRLGAYLALTAGSIGAGDAIEVGLADRFVPSDRLPDLLVALESELPDEAIAAFAVAAPASDLASARSWIDPAFSAVRVPEVLAALRSDPSNERAVATAAAVEAMSPIASAVSLEALARAAALPDLESALAQELRVSAHAIVTHDFAEGVRARVIDKDRTPRWRPALASEIDRAAVEAYFQPIRPLPGHAGRDRGETSNEHTGSTGMTDYENILIERRGRVGIITLNRPKALNALNAALMRDVVAAVEEFDVDRGIGAIVLTGSDRAFAAGADVKEMAPLSYQDAYLDGLLADWGRFTEVRTPIVAAVAGFALGGGCELAMMCDILIAADTAQFGQPEINLGVIPGMGGTQRLTRAVGKAKAMDLILTGRMMGAEEAERSGLVARVVPAEQLLGTAIDVASTIAEKSLPVAYAAKEAVNVAFESTLAEGVRFERRAFNATFALVDQKEGMAAFTEKRDPVFVHG